MPTFSGSDGVVRAIIRQNVDSACSEVRRAHLPVPALRDEEHTESRCEDPLAIEEEWRELARRSASPFEYPDWFFHWHDAFGRGRLRALTARDAGRLTGVVALDVARPILRSAANAHTPRFAVVAATASARQSLSERLVRLHPFVSLTSLDARDADEIVRAARQTGSHLARATVATSPFVPIDQAWDRYLDSRSTKMLADLERRTRRLEEQLGPVALEVLDSFADDATLQDALATGFALESSGWKAEQRTAIVSESGTRRFYEQIAAWTAREGWLRLVFLRAGARRVAFHFALEHDRVYYLLKGGYDPDFRQAAPGRLLARLALARAFELRLERYEFLGGPESWKLEWTENVRTLHSIQVFAPSAIGRALRTASAVARLGRRLRAAR
jgi:CelD/BcsL family acetyltransferase involved in cellulose biosynthesis